MGTRSMIAVQRYWNSPYELFYRHMDGYATGLGVELIEAMKQGLSVEEIMEKVGAEPERRSVERPEDAFLKVQGDLEWIYVICNPTDAKTISLQILRTSCPDFWFNGAENATDFVFSAWFSYVQYFPENYKEVMRQVERTAEITLNALAALEKAKKAIS